MNALNLHFVKSVQLGPINGVLVGPTMSYYRTLYVETTTGTIQVTMFSDTVSSEINVENVSNEPTHS